VTVIAWDGKTLAADKRGSQGGFTFTVTKIFRVGDRLVGFAGNASRIGEFRAWLEAGADPKAYPVNKHEGDGSECCWMLVIRADGVIEKYESSGYPIIVEERHFASGNGRDYATAAMHLGCDAKTAVDIACRFDDSCGNGVDTLTLETTQAE
jgi:hypothetical protein